MERTVLIAMTAGWFACGTSEVGPGPHASHGTVLGPDMWLQSGQLRGVRTTDWLAERQSAVRLDVNPNGEWYLQDVTEAPSYVFFDTDGDGQYQIGREPIAACGLETVGASTTPRCVLAPTKLALSHQWTYRGTIGNRESSPDLTGTWEETLEFIGEFFDTGGNPIDGARICWSEQNVCASSDGRSARVSVPLCGAHADDSPELSFEIGGERHRVVLDPGPLGQPVVSIEVNESVVGVNLFLGVQPTQVVVEVQHRGSVTWTSASLAPGTASLSATGARAVVPRSELTQGNMIVIEAVALGPVDSLGQLGDEPVVGRSIMEARASLLWSVE